MDGLSEDDSSDSSSEYLVDPDKINFNSSFFAGKTARVDTVSNGSDTEEEDSDDEDQDDASQPVNIELFTQVLKNLEYSEKLHIDDASVCKDLSASDCSISERGKVRDERTRQEIDTTASSVEIDELLLRGETDISSPVKEASLRTVAKSDDDAGGSAEYTIPKEGVKIVLPGTGVLLKRKRRGGPDLKAILRKRLRASQILVEKVGLLCWLAYGFHLNRQINQPEIMAGLLSLVSTCNYPKDRIDLSYLERFTKWFRQIFVFENAEGGGSRKLDNDTLLKVLRDKKVGDYKELVLLYVAALRALGLNCRLVVSLCPPHRIFSDSPLFKVDSKGQECKPKASAVKRESSKGNKDDKTPGKSAMVENSTEAKKTANAEAKKRAAEILRANTRSNTKRSKTEERKDDAKVADSEKSGPNLRQLRSRRVNVNTEEVNTTKSKDLSAVVDGKKSKYYVEEESSDSEAEFQSKPKRVTKKNTNKDQEEAPQTSKSTRKNTRKLISSDSDAERTGKERKTQELWAEIYLESEESWICANVMEEKIHCSAELYKKARKPVLYVVAWNSVGTIKDVTRRYCPQWLTVTRKQRVDEKWWLESLSYWKEKDSAISKAEDEMLLQRELEQPLPKTIGECKSHPLYVIARHLLKFEGLYPPDCLPLGHTSTGDAIYSRHCVHTLCSRETWLKKARVVKPQQEPYKIVKARPKYDKLSGMKIKDSALELFGEWQTMEYEPPVAKDGIVPRNEYGNVDLFKQCMLPKGTVHINLPGLNRIARKLNIDCAPAVVGFNFGCMGAVPALEGSVVCSEFEDTLREAWEAEQAEAEKRAREKQEKRVYGNWKRLIQGLKIRERLAIKYEFSEETKSAVNKRAKQKKTDAKKTKVS